jgi:hypothetical protein
VSLVRLRSRISTPKPKLPPLNNWLLLRPTITLDTTTPAMITQVTTTVRARPSILVMTRRTMMRMMERRSMLLVSRTRISSWS